MARARNPNRDEAKKAWLESGGAMTTKELSAMAGVPESRIRKWKSEDQWKAALARKKPGGQRGNKNAVGHGAPIGNNNAETHGAYATVHLEDLTKEEREYIESLTLDISAAMLREFQLLMAKERDLARKIKQYEQADQSELYIDRVVEMLVPKDTKSPKNVDIDHLKTAMRTVIRSSPFDRAMKLEAEYNKVHGRILKLVDTMRAHGVDKKRLDLDERKHILMKQRLSGQYDIDPDTGDIRDTDDPDHIDTPTDSYDPDTNSLDTPDATQ